MHIIAIVGAVFRVPFLVLMRMQQATHAARDLADAAGDARGLFRRFGLSPLILGSCGPQERSDLVEMLRRVAAADAGSDDVLVRDIARFGHALRSS